MGSKLSRYPKSTTQFALCQTLQVQTNLLRDILSHCLAFKKQFLQWGSLRIAQILILTWVIGSLPCVLNRRKFALLSYHGLNCWTLAFLWDWLRCQMSTNKRFPSCSLIWRKLRSTLKISCFFWLFWRPFIDLKRSFLQINVSFKISHQGVKPQENRIESIMNIATPTYGHQVCSFLGTINHYKQMILNHSHVATALTALTKKGTRFKWTSNWQATFDNQKLKLAKQVMLT